MSQSIASSAKPSVTRRSRVRLAFLLGGVLLVILGICGTLIPAALSFRLYQREPDMLVSAVGFVILFALYAGGVVLIGATLVADAFPPRRTR